MKSNRQFSPLAIWFRELRAPFFTASIVPVLVGTALAYTTTAVFEPLLFVLAMTAMLFLHAGANMANDYFDHLSGNDWLNQNPTPFSGGSQLIQQGMVSPGAVLTAALIAFTAAIVLGAVIIAFTHNFFLLLLGLAGLLGGFFYTAPPLKMGYRTAGELVIALLFGLLPVYGAYYIQTVAFDLNPIAPGLVIAALIFLVILGNEFPDAPADRHVNKKTLVVRLGKTTAIWIYRIVLVLTYLIALIMALLIPQMRLASILYILTFPVAVLALKFLNSNVLGKTKGHRFNQLTILLHLAGGLMLALGLLISGLFA